jgi:hypothetical protein
MTGCAGWQTLALVIDCHTQELLGWQLSRSGRAGDGNGGALARAGSALGSPRACRSIVTLKSEDGLGLTSCAYTRLVRSDARREGLTMQHSAQSSEMIERVSRALKEYYHTSSSLGNSTTRLACRRTIDPFLLHPAAEPGPRHENPCYGVSFSSLACVENGGSLPFPQAKNLYYHAPPQCGIARGFSRRNSASPWSVN